jgi:hypothetical protein
MTTTTHHYQSDFARRYFDQGATQGKAEGKAEGMATAVLDVFDARGIADVRERILCCTDIDQLDTWIRRAVTVAAARDVLGPARS